MVRKLVLLLAAGLVLACASGVNAEVLWQYWYDAAVNGDLDSLKAFADFPCDPHEVVYL